MIRAYYFYGLTVYGKIYTLIQTDDAVEICSDLGQAVKTLRTSPPVVRIPLLLAPFLFLKSVG